MVVQYNSWHTEAGIEWRQEELLTGGGRRGQRWQSWRIISNRGEGQAAISFMPDIDDSESISLLDSSLFTLKKMTQWCLGSSSFSSCHRWQSSTRLHSEHPWQPSFIILHSNVVPQKLTIPPQIKPHCHFLHCESLQFFSYFFLLSLFILFLWASKSIRSSLVSSSCCTARRRQWQATPVLLPRKSHGWRSLVGCSPWGRYELVETERFHFDFSLSRNGEGNGNSL